MLDELEWPSLEAHSEQSSLTLFYKIHSGTVSLDKDKYLTRHQICKEQGHLITHSTLDLNLNLNLNSLLVKRQIDNPSPGAVTGGNYSLALTREVKLDTISNDSSEEEIRDSGRSFQSLIVWGKKLYL